MTKLEKLKNLVEDRGYSIDNFHLGGYGLIIKLLGIEGGELQKKTIHVLKTEPQFNDILIYAVDKL